MDAGTIWFEALSNTGRNIGNAIRQRQDERKRLDQFDQFMQKGSQMSVAGVPLVNPKLLKMWSQQTRDQKLKSEGAFEMLAGIQTNLATNVAQARARSQAMPAFITDPVTGTRMYRTRNGYSPLNRRTGASDVEKAVGRYSASLGLTPKEFSQIDPNKLEMYDQFGKPIDPKTPLPPAYAIGKVGSKQFRIPTKDIQRFSNMVGLSKQTPQERTGGFGRPSMPNPGEIRKGYRFKGGNPGDQNSWEKVDA